MLAVLFVVGATFLTTVTFESRSVAGAKKANQQATVVESLSREVRRALVRSFLGDDGKPWNYELVRDTDGDQIPDAPSMIGNDISGEIPGVHPLLASIEPYDPSGGVNSPPTWFFYSASDLELTLDETPIYAAVDIGAGPQWGRNLVYVDEALGLRHTHPDFNTSFNQTQDKEKTEGHSNLVQNLPDSPAEVYRRDADGDGVWDSYEYLLPYDRFPDSVRGELGDELKTEEAFENEIYYAVRVIPHGAMVDVAHAHKTLLEELLGSEAVNVGGPYVAEGEELLLRRRGLIPPRALALSQLQTPSVDGQIPFALYGAFDFDQQAPSYRWWPIRTGTDGQDIIEITGQDSVPGWIDWVDPLTVNGTYDVRHLLTTVSHDDQLMRIGRSTNDVSLDWIEDIVAGNLDPDNFAIDEWPDAGDPTNKLNGRLKVSLPGLVTRILIPEGLPLFGPGGTHDGREIDALSDPALNSAVRDRFIWTIQDAFLLMLRNVDFDGDGILEPDPEDDAVRATTAAALTANLIDFADFDGDTNGDGNRNVDDQPTKVVVRDVSGLPTADAAVYGLERQPYITEIYHRDDGDGTIVSAVELFNPYDFSIILSNYKLVDSGLLVDPPFQLDEDLTGNLLSGSYVVFVSDEVVDDPLQGTQLGAAGSWKFEDVSIVELQRTGLDDEVIVDQFAVDGSPDFGTSSSKVSLERVTGDTSTPRDQWAWTWVVPESQPTDTHTMDNGGADNNFGNANPNASIRPVQIEFADTSDLVSAFPTTGSLLLLSRYANSADDPFTGDLSTDPDKIDNGRMPLFEQGELAYDPTAPGADPNDPFALYIPWGQLVFDYFTALPLSNAYDPLVPSDMTPTIDEGGLRVHGRIDINSAPWTVLAGLPLAPKSAFGGLPESMQDKIADTAVLDDDLPIRLGDELAQSIVAYREARQVGGSFDFGPVNARLRSDENGSPLSGFLTVGELANVRRPGGGGGSYDVDSGVIDGTANEDYVKAVAVLVALGDWVTTRSHVFTVYATLRGSGTKSAVDEKAIRFQETVDRLPSFFNNRLPRRVGPRVVGSYAQASQD